MSTPSLRSLGLIASVTLVTFSACNQHKHSSPHKHEKNARFVSAPFADTVFFENKATFILHKSPNTPDTAPPVYNRIVFHTSRQQFERDASFYAITEYGDTLKYFTIWSHPSQHNEDDERPILIEPTPRYQPHSP